MLARRVAVIGVASGYGAGDPACQDGSEVIRALRFLSDLEVSTPGCTGTSRSGWRCQILPTRWMPWKTLPANSRTASGNTWSRAIFRW